MKMTAGGDEAARAFFDHRAADQGLKFAGLDGRPALESAKEGLASVMNMSQRFQAGDPSALPKIPGRVGLCEARAFFTKYGVHTREQKRDILS